MDDVQPSTTPPQTVGVQPPTVVPGHNVTAPPATGAHVGPVDNVQPLAPNDTMDDVQPSASGGQSQGTPPPSGSGAARGSSSTPAAAPGSVDNVQPLTPSGMMDDVQPSASGPPRPTDGPSELERQRQAQAIARLRRENARLQEQLRPLGQGAPEDDPGPVAPKALFFPATPARRAPVTQGGRHDGDEPIYIKIYHDQLVNSALTTGKGVSISSTTPTFRKNKPGTDVHEPVAFITALAMWSATAAHPSKWGQLGMQAVGQTVTVKLHDALARYGGMMACASPTWTQFCEALLFSANIDGRKQAAIQSMMAIRPTEDEEATAFLDRMYAIASTEAQMDVHAADDAAHVNTVALLQRMTAGDSRQCKEFAETILTHKRQGLASNWAACRSLQDVMDAAVTWTTSQMLFATPTPTSVGDAWLAHESDERPTIAKRPGPAANEVDDTGWEQRRRQLSERRCYECDEPGHWAVDCHRRRDGGGDGHRRRPAGEATHFGGRARHGGAGRGAAE